MHSNGRNIEIPVCIRSVLKIRVSYTQMSWDLVQFSLIHLDNSIPCMRRRLNQTTVRPISRYYICIYIYDTFSLFLDVRKWAFTWAALHSFTELHNMLNSFQFSCFGRTNIYFFNVYVYTYIHIYWYPHLLSRNNIRSNEFELHLACFCVWFFFIRFMSFSFILSFSPTTLTLMQARLRTHILTTWGWQV